MIIQSIRIENFKNYEKAELLFFEDINCLTGLNGAGKTNILDAIYYLCTGKSYFNASDLQLIYDDADYFSLRSEFILDNKQEEVMCVLVKGRRKVIKRNDETYARITDHYGSFPVVMISPADLELIMGASDERRKWLDGTISWIDRSYLQALIKYDKILRQRNAELRIMDPQNSRQPSTLIGVYDEMLIPIAEEIHKARFDFMEAFLPYFTTYYQTISQKSEAVSLDYVSSMHGERIRNLLVASYQKDLVLQRTNVGPHRDDLDFKIGGSPLKKFGSQGQQKSFLLALKLAQHQYLKAQKGVSPILLLDDVCERLDEHRLSILFRLIQEKEHFGQVFVSDTSFERIKKFLNPDIKFADFRVVKGKISIV